MEELNSDKDRLNLGPIVVEELKETDIDQLEPILREHVRNSETGKIISGEIDDIKGYMSGSTDEYGRTRQYLVAKNSQGQILGCMGYTEPDPDLIKHYNTTTEESMELVNAFVSIGVYRGGGIGRKLFNAVCDLARKNGKRQVVLSSGPRYKDSWGFYDKVCDEKSGMLVDKYGEGRHAPTWRKFLS